MPLNIPNRNLTDRWRGLSSIEGIAARAALCRDRNCSTKIPTVDFLVSLYWPIPKVHKAISNHFNVSCPWRKIVHPWSLTEIHLQQHSYEQLCSNLLIVKKYSQIDKHSALCCVLSDQKTAEMTKNTEAHKLHKQQISSTQHGTKQTKQTKYVRN